MWHGNASADNLLYIATVVTSEPSFSQKYDVQATCTPRGQSCRWADWLQYTTAAWCASKRHTWGFNQWHHTWIQPHGRVLILKHTRQKCTLHFSIQENAAPISRFSLVESGKDNLQWHMVFLSIFLYSQHKSMMALLIDSLSTILPCPLLSLISTALPFEMSGSCQPIWCTIIYTRMIKKLKTRHDSLISRLRTHREKLFSAIWWGLKGQHSCMLCANWQRCYT